MKYAFFVVFVSVFLASESAYTDFLSPCPINDGECQKQLFQRVMPHFAAGVPELNMSSVDPLYLKEIRTGIPNLVDVVLDDGVAKGIRNCIFEKMSTDIEKEHASMEVRCNITLKGHYKARSKAPDPQFSILNDILDADGQARVNIFNVRVKFDFDFAAVRDADGQIRLRCKKGHFDYTYELGDKITFTVNNVYLRKLDISKQVVNFLNENWRFVVDAVGKPFLDTIMDAVQDFEYKFFRNVPAKYFVSDDLEKYIQEI